MRLARIAVVALLSVIAIFAVACGSESGFETYTDDTNGFSLSVPDGWEIEPMDTTKSAVFTCSSACVGVANVVEITQDYSGDAEDYYTGTIKPTNDEIPGLDLSLKEDITIDGVSAIKVIWTLNQDEDSDKAMYYILVKGQTLWVITFHSESSCWDTYEDTFDIIANSFHILD